MNKVFISGTIVNNLVFRMEAGEVPHLVFNLNVSHKSREGSAHDEIYRINAWNNAARWGSDNLKQGQAIALQGRLAQRKIIAGDVSAIAVEIVAEEFFSGSQPLLNVPGNVEDKRNAEKAAAATDA